MDYEEEEDEILIEDNVPIAAGSVGVAASSAFTS